MAKDKSPQRIAKELAETTALQTLYKAIENLADENISTPCFGNELFTMDFIHGDDIGDICTPCPVFTLCKNYAVIARPEAGVWAGRRWNSTHEKPIITESESND